MVLIIMLYILIVMLIEVINDSYSQLLEFAYPTDRTKVYLNDYAKIIMSHNVTAQVRRYFPETTE